MEKEKLVLCDTNIIIEFYRGNDTILADLKSVGQEKIAISAVTAGELLFGAINKQELRQIQTDLSYLNLIQVNEDISSKCLELMATYALSHKLSLPDALIAATALYCVIPLFTLNQKDFRYITGLELYVPRKSA